MTTTNEDASPRPSNDVFRLMYRSRSRIPAEARKAELGRLFSSARSNNKEQHICGALLLSGDSFVQVLEGDETAVRALFDHISHDERHDSVALLKVEAVPEPVFARWHMARVSDDGNPDVPLIAHQDGIAPASGRGTTSDQERVLDVMRHAARTQPYFA